MRKALIAASMLSAFGVAQADIVGYSTNTGVAQAGTSTVETGPWGPHHAGLPGIGVDGTNIIDLAGISTSTYLEDTVSGFDIYNLPGYTHQGEGGTITSVFNWAQVPTGSEEVYFGLVTAQGSPNETAAFYVGDRTGWAIPTSNTSYTTVALVETGGDGSSPAVLQGTLYLNGTLSTGSSSLTDGTNNLTIDTTVDYLAGTFNGTSAYNSDSGTASGSFFGSGSSSAVAGVADGGSAYQAAFGGIAQ